MEHDEKMSEEQDNPQAVEQPEEQSVDSTSEADHDPAMAADSHADGGAAAESGSENADLEEGSDREPVENLWLQQIIEGALLAAGEALSIKRIQSLFDEAEQPETADVRAALNAIQTHCESRGFELVEVASGWRFQVREDLATWVNRLWEEKPQKYSRALLETLALIAYRQPITRGDIEEVRGVAVSSHIIKTLTEREWVKVVGHRDVPGRPALYATTRQFLDYFNMKSLDELPSLGELKDIDGLNQDLEFEEAANSSDAADAGDTNPDNASAEHDVAQPDDTQVERVEAEASESDIVSEDDETFASQEADGGDGDELIGQAPSSEDVNTSPDYPEDFSADHDADDDDTEEHDDPRAG